MILIAKDRGSPTSLAQDEADRQRGYDAAMNARPYAVPPSIRTCWIAGYMEATPQSRRGKGRTD
jgi:hypothetical protein